MWSEIYLEKILSTTIESYSKVSADFFNHITSTIDNEIFLIEKKDLDPTNEFSWNYITMKRYDHYFAMKWSESMTISPFRIIYKTNN